MRLIENEDLGLLVLRNEDPPATTWRNCTIERVTILNCQLREPLRFEGCTFWSHGHFVMIGNYICDRGSVFFDEGCTFPAVIVETPEQRIRMSLRRLGWEAQRRFRNTLAALRGARMEDD